MKNPKIFVIIVTYKGKRWYDKCFGSLRVSTIPLQVVVVDNTPGEEDAEYIKSHFPEVHLIKTNENLGFGRANNLGMRYALNNECDYVFLMNQDAWIKPDTMATLVKVADQHKEYALYSPMHMRADMQHLNIALNSDNGNYELLSDLYTHSLKDIYTITYVNAAAWLLPRKTLETIGGFCPLIFHYGEDDDFMNRLRYHEKCMGLVPLAQIVHDSTTQVEEQDVLRKKAAEMDVVTLLDINNPVSLNSMRLYFFRKMLLGLVSGNKSQYQYYKGRFRILSQNIKVINSCRKQHKVIQANWLL